MISIGTFAVVGGGETGAGYVRQLLRAVAAGRLETQRIFVLDRDPACRVSQLDLGGARPSVRLVVSDWSDWLEAGLDDLGPEAHLVPHHWAPHLLLEWLRRQCSKAGARVEPAGELAPRGLPFEAVTRAGDRALSYASWLCPPTCIEPELCPHTRGPRDWSLAADLERPGPEGCGEHLVFRCLHLVYGVGTIPVAEVLAARDRLIAGRRDGVRSYLVATSSHCHALAAAVRVIPD